jgi:D-lactate dehydrogenase
VRKKKNFSARGIHKIETFELAGKKIGVIGTGRIGKHFIQIAKGLGMEVLAFDKFKDEKFAKKHKFEYVPLAELLKNSDIISLHLPLLPSTKHLLSKKEFQKMKDGVIILNTARGALIKTQDFYEALKSGKIAGAGLDVLENEDCLGREHHNQKCDAKIKTLNKKIIGMKNVIVTPHNAFNAKEASERRINFSIEEIREFLK